MRLGLLALVALFISSLASAQSIEAEGIGTIDAGGDLEQARQEAIQDALQQAALSVAAQVRSSSVMDATGRLQENLHVTPAAVVSSHTVLREWSAEGLLHVRIRAEVQPQNTAALEKSGQKVSVRVPEFKKKIAVTRFHVMNSLQLEDISNIWDGYPLEVLRRLERIGSVLPVNSLSSLLSVGSEPIVDSPRNQDMIRRIAEQTGSQFVISGVILDAGIVGEIIRPYLGWQGTESGKRSELSLPWPNLAVGFKPEPTARRLEVEVFLHDGLSGALIARHRSSAEAGGRVTVGRDKPFASVAFFATPFGRTTEHVINSQTEALSQDLACLPFMANIVRIQGTKVFLDAGGTSGLRPGNVLTVYHKSPSAPISSLSGATALGIPEAPATTVTLREVQPLFAVGELAADSAKHNLQVGDVVRFEAERPEK